MSDETISLNEFITYVKNNLDFNDLDSIKSAAPMLVKLSNDKDLLPKAICEELKDSPEKFQMDNPYQANGYLLYKDDDFILRAVCWIPDKDQKFLNVSIDRSLLIYSIAHDHDFNFLTVGHYGPGYYSETYIYDYNSVIGESGEDVLIKKCDFKKLKPNQTYLFRAGKEIHKQLPPDEFSISLNLIVRKRGPERFMDQYAFDIDQKKIIKPLENDTFKRAQLIPLIADLLNTECLPIFEELKDSHSCRRTRIEIIKVLSTFKPESHYKMWSHLKNSPDPILQNAAKKFI